ncbi:ATP-binding protein [Microlunatus ginsengisoli]|uniref:ATP-binding protein n=1 Tax=Microlunatus ginsengisoli TaxID=363863 RepID=UPI0031D1F56A
MENPYAPGAGTEPYRLPGRAEAQVWWRRCLTDIEGLGHTTMRGRAFTGVRGVGKTALLRYFEREAGTRGFGVASVQAGGADSVRAYLTDVISGLQRPEPSFTDKHGQIVELGVRVGPVEVGAARDLPDEPPGPPLEIAFFNLISATASAFAARRRGLVVLVDEAQDCDLPSLVSLCRVQHQLRRPAFQLVLAGLPELEDAIDEAITHSDRLFEYRELGNLDRDATREALLEPAAVHGVGWTDDAVDFVIELSEGYPSFVQEYGFAIWEALGSRREIDLDLARAGAEQARLNVARQYRSVWRSVTPAGRDYLTALAAVGGEARTAAVADALGRRPSELTMTLKMLKDRGAVRVPQRGSVAFSRPGMDAWVRDEQG